MKKIVIFLFTIAFSVLTYAQEAKRKITGKIAAEDGPLKGVNIRIKNTDTGVLTNGKGKYEIDTYIGDVLVFSYIGFHTIEVTVDENNVYNLDMYPAVEELDEVVVKKKKEKAFTQKELLAEFPTNKDLIKTSWGILDQVRSSYSMRILDGSEILQMGPDFLTSLQVHFPNMLVARDSFPLRVYFRRTGQYNAHAIFDVDGFIYNDAPTFIIPSEIDRIAVIQGNGAYIRYGTAGAGGVIIINTKEKTKVDDLSVERKYDNLNLVDSLMGQVTEKPRFREVTQEYLKKLNLAKSEEAGLNLYETQKDEFIDSPSYYLDAADYFIRKWNNESQSQKILNNYEDRFSDSTAALKALAYRYETIGQKEKALTVYLKILTIASKEAESHRDVANAYALLGNYKKALSYFTRFELAVNSLDSIPFDTYGVDLLMTTEVNTILVLKSKELALTEADVRDTNLPEHNARLLFEWNQTDVDFGLEIVSPDDYFDTWNNPKSGSLEKSRGYKSQQFFLDDDFDGEWKVNLEYRGNETDLPTYLKVTAFFDYGKETQSQQSKVFKLSEKEGFVKLLSIFTNKRTITP